MGLKPQFTKADIRAELDRKLAAYRKAMLNRLMQAGEKFVAMARSVDTYKDQSGNLRSSVGYIILKDGSEVIRDFEQVKEGTAGIAKGEQTALKYAPSKGYCLIGVAGMDYAAAVEAKGRDVITGSSQVIESWLKNALAGLKSKM